MKNLSALRIMLTETPDHLLGALGPILARGSLNIERVRRAEQALERLIVEPFDIVVTSYPLVSVTMRTFLLGLRRPPSVSARAKLLVAVDAERRGELAPFLIERGIDEVTSPNEDPLLVQHAFSNILGVAPRAAVRLVLRLEAQLEGTEGATSMLCTSVDLSASGAMIESTSLLPVGTGVTLRLFVPSEREPVTAQAEVVRHADPRFDRTGGFAVRFVELEGPSAGILARFLERESV